MYLHALRLFIDRIRQLRQFKFHQNYSCLGFSFHNSTKKCCYELCDICNIYSKQKQLQTVYTTITWQRVRAHKNVVYYLIQIYEEWNDHGNVWYFQQRCALAHVSSALKLLVTHRWCWKTEGVHRFHWLNAFNVLLMSVRTFICHWSRRLPSWYPLV